MTPTSQPIMTLDIGTTKVCAIVGQPAPTGRFNILAISKKASLGVIKGEIYNVTHASRVITDVVKTALQKARLDSAPLFLSLNSGAVQFKCIKVFIKKNRKTPIDEYDLSAIKEEVKSTYNAPGTYTFYLGIQYLIIHHEEEQIKLPLHEAIGVEAQTIEAVVSTVRVNERAINILREVIKSTGLRVDGVCLQPIASASATITPTEAKHGTLLIDIGGGTTDVALIKDNAPAFVGVIQLGGKTITSDIATVLRIPEEEAEKRKLSAGKIYSPQLIKSLKRPGKNKDWKVEEICLARLIEIFNLAIDLVGEETIQSSCKNVVLTGGGSLMKGIKQLAETMFKKSVRIGYPSRWIEKSLDNELPKDEPSPIYSTAIGMLVEAARDNILDLPEITENGVNPMEAFPIGGSVVKRVSRWLLDLLSFGKRLPSLLSPEAEDPKL